MNEKKTKKTTIKRLLSIARSLVVIVMLGVTRFVLGKTHRKNNRRLDGMILSTIIIHWCSIQALARLHNPYAVGDRVLYKNMDRQDRYFVVARISGDVVFSDGSSDSGHSMMSWRTLLLNELLHEWRYLNTFRIDEINDLLRLETIL